MTAIAPEPLTLVMNPLQYKLFSLVARGIGKPPAELTRDEVLMFLAALAATVGDEDIREWLLPHVDDRRVIVIEAWSPECGWLFTHHYRDDPVSYVTA